MSSTAIYFAAGDTPDAAIEKGLTDAGCAIQRTRSIAATAAALQPDAESPPAPALLVAEIQAGALLLLTLLHEQRCDLPPVVLYDRVGADIHAVIKALKFRVKDYLLASDPDFQREVRVRILAEGVLLEAKTAAPGPPARVRPGVSRLVAMPGFNWDPAASVIHVNGGCLRLSPVEGRVFDLLLSNRSAAVLLGDLVTQGLSNPRIDARSGARLLRPHMMRLRHKLERHPELAHRIVSLRGSGYMFI